MSSFARAQGVHGVKELGKLLWQRLPFLCQFVEGSTIKTDFCLVFLSRRSGKETGTKEGSLGKTGGDNNPSTGSFPERWGAPSPFRDDLGMHC